MPIPKPKKDEDKDTFIERCMSNNTMVSEYPDEKQRYAICLQAWKDKDDKSKSQEIEKRTFNLDLIEERQDGEEGYLIGHAAIFSNYENMGWYEERIQPGAFKDSIKKDDIRALFNHDPNYVIGRNKAKTLTLSEDEKGLAIKINPPDTQFAKDLITLIRRGDISQMSFAFQTIEDKWIYGDGEKSDKRDLIKVKLFDVSPVTFPAYEDTDVAVRSYLKSIKQSEIRPFRTNLLRRRLNLKEKGR